MHILFDLKTIIVLVCIVLALLCIGYHFMFEKVKEWRKRRARTLLCNEIDVYKNKIKRLKYCESIIDDMRNREAILCPTLLKGVIDAMPGPNELTLARDGDGMILGGHRRVALNIAGRGEVAFDLKFIADKGVPTGERGLTVRIEPTGQEVRFTLRLQNRIQRIQGVDVEVNSYYWDLRFSGIQLIEDVSYGRIIDFILSSRVVNEAFGMNGAKYTGEL